VGDRTDATTQRQQTGETQHTETEPLHATDSNERKEHPMKNASRWAAALTLFAILLAAVPAHAAEPAKRGVVNVNTAEAAQLALLPRIGPSVAGRIIEFRKKNGPFKSAEDLMLVRGIGERTFALLKPYVATSGQTTLAEKVSVPRAAAKQGSR